MFYRIGNGPALAAFSASPVGSTTTPPSTVTIGKGPDSLALQVSEDAFQGDAQFTVSVDGTQIGGTQTTTAAHSAGQTQTFDVLGTFAPGPHTATINLLNDVDGGLTSTSRNLYVTGATIDNTVISAAKIGEIVNGSQSFSFLAPGTSGSTTDLVTVNQPANLTSGVQTITGTESDPSQSIFLDWRTESVPTLANTDWVKATVNSSGSFSASVNFSAPVNIDHPGVQSTMYYRVGSGPTVSAWSATPS
jgi:hypothetical protein